ncbi:ParB/RepB/Spo0J family partition protein [Pandoraea communis]|uniref:ParB/RepB/Spo0J family partition protein n=1 Tax=Pandoraea communis TaxID=2508297 RepID=UPI0025A65467|nr:ParB/Srx family N-terminal domain-containing protein [Pandoraea communis]MDM8356644.1 ParB/Srx family N-terminal domain-containing protein [Pandoraea communis]
MTATPSFKQKINEKEIRRADAMKIRYEDIHVEPGFNLRAALDLLDGESLEKAKEDDDSLFRHIMAGGQYPALEVRPRAEGGVWLVDGHRRHAAIGRADAAGAPLRDRDGELMVRIDAFNGNDADRTVRILSSNKNRQLHPLEKAFGYQRLARFGWDNPRIAQADHVSPQWVGKMLVLAGANSDVHRLVFAGKTSASVAADAVRQYGEQAGAFLSGEFEKASAGGKKKVTAGSIKGKPYSRKAVTTYVERIGTFVSALPDADREAIANSETDFPVTVSAKALRELLAAHSDISAASAPATPAAGA